MEKHGGIHNNKQGDWEYFVEQRDAEEYAKHTRDTKKLPLNYCSICYKDMLKDGTMPTLPAIPMLEKTPTVDRSKTNYNDTQVSVAEFHKLQEILFVNLKNILENHEGVSIFASNHSKFEGWLKVELIQILKNHNYGDVLPEKDRIDVTFGNWALELKTCNTNYRHEKVTDKPRPITNNIQDILDDICSLNKSRYRCKGIFFVVFPLDCKNIKKWAPHLDKISRTVQDLKCQEFSFKNGIPGVMYMCRI